MGNAKDVMWNQGGKHAMSAWKERRSLQAMLWALEEGAEAARLQGGLRVMTCTYCGGRCYEGEKCSGCGGHAFFAPVTK